MTLNDLLRSLLVTEDGCSARFVLAVK